MTELDYINLDSIELRRCSIVTNVVVTNVFLQRRWFHPKHSMWWHKVMSLMYYLVCDERIHIYFTRMYWNHCPHNICFWRPRHFVSHFKSHLPLVTPKRQMKPVAVVFIWHGDQQRYRDSPVHFIQCMWYVAIFKSSAFAYTCSWCHRGFSAKDTDAFVGYFLRNWPLKFPVLKTTVNVDED